LPNEFGAQVFDAVPKRALEAAAEFFGDVLDCNEGIGHGLISIFMLDTIDRICRIFFG